MQIENGDISKSRLRETENGDLRKNRLTIRKWEIKQTQIDSNRKWGCKQYD